MPKRRPWLHVARAERSTPSALPLSRGCDSRCATSGVRLRSTRAGGQLESHGCLQGQRPVFVPPTFPRTPNLALRLAFQAERNGLENRCGPQGRPRVRIPPSAQSRRECCGDRASDQVGGKIGTQLARLLARSDEPRQSGSNLSPSAGRARRRPPALDESAINCRLALDGAAQVPPRLFQGALPGV